MTGSHANRAEESAAWRLFCYNWVMLGLMAAALAAGMAIAGFSIVPASAVKPFAVVAVYVGYTLYKYCRPQQGDLKVTFILGSTGQLLLIPVLMTPLTYIAASANLPMQDVALNALDRALGLDWMAYFNFAYSRYALLYATLLAYSMIGMACVRRADCAGSDRTLSAHAAIHVGLRDRAGSDDCHFGTGTGDGHL